MFGYVVPLKNELKIKEFDIFKGYYCGICKSIGKINYPTKYFLNYDMAFLALFLSSIEHERQIPLRNFCPYKFRKVNFYLNEYIEYAAFLNVFLVNRKLMDNYKDNNNIIYYLASKLIKANYSSSIKEKLKNIDKYLHEIFKLEKENSSDLDILSHYFGKVLEEIFDVFDDKRKIALKYFGYNLGRWIYVIDALDDLKEDIKKGIYNPLKDKLDIDAVRFALYSYLDNLTKAYEIMEIKKNKGLLDNIIYLGLADKTETVLKGENKNEGSIRSFRCK
ncbi:MULTISPECIES: DUF5685 family protein [Caloramator]|uniref:Uncharacterized protein n=1 Tax=Caloramator australicus RC3 TaxID=857293 RepID=I7LIP1_9CLOT|nr:MULTISPECIES: DUF5685 family protein [Caloramator]MDO6354876.1 DUF5685 family protein [Caloramator sp. CAR-1]CCJ33112.1 hypothetical protein CAAU_1028 [Caloramator australicus RC3]